MLKNTLRQCPRASACKTFQNFQVCRNLAQHCIPFFMLEIQKIGIQSVSKYLSRAIDQFSLGSGMEWILCMHRESSGDKVCLVTLLVACRKESPCFCTVKLHWGFAVGGQSAIYTAA